MNASQAKQRGARCYAAKDYAGAVTCFTEAIARADGNDMDLHLYHSNRCAAYQQLGRWREALEDAEATTQISPTWAKGWSRLGACLERDQRRRGEAAAAYARAAELDPGRPPPRQSDGLDAVTRLRIWYEGLDGLNKMGVWAAALFALYFLLIILGGSRRGYTPRRRARVGGCPWDDSFHSARRRARAGGGPWDHSFHSAQRRARVGGGRWDHSFHSPRRARVRWGSVG